MIVHCNGSLCRSDPHFQHNVQIAGVRQPFAAVCTLARTEVVAFVIVSILTPEQHFASCAVTSTSNARAVFDLLLLQAFFTGWQLNAQVTDHRTAYAACGQTCLQSCDVYEKCTVNLYLNEVGTQDKTAGEARSWWQLSVYKYNNRKDARNTKW